jgi:spore coat polysaccharide biosynthesis protein SpsF (cytidylyltransferase family)
VVNKSLKDICFIIQARLNSTRVPRKMIKPFSDTTLMELGILKVLDSK